MLKKCSRADVLYVLTCRRALCACVLTCLAYLRAHMPTCFACSRAHISPCIASLCAHVQTWIASPRAHMPTYLESLAFNGLRYHVITCQHALPPQEVVLMPLFAVSMQLLLELYTLLVRFKS